MALTVADATFHPAGAAQWNELVALLTGGTGTITTGALTVSTGNLTVSTGQVLAADGVAGTPGFAFATEPDLGMFRLSANRLVLSSTAGNVGFLANDNASGSRALVLSFGLAASITTGVSADVIIERDAANTLAQRNGTNAQRLNIYNTFTSSTNYEMGFARWVSNVFVIGTEKGSGGGTQRVIAVGDGTINNTGSIALNQTTGVIDFAKSGVAIRWTIDTNGHFVAGADNTYDIGASGATRPRTIYAGTSVVSPAYTVGSTAGASFSGAVTNITVVNGIVTAAS